MGSEYLESLLKELDSDSDSDKDIDGDKDINLTHVEADQSSRRDAHKPENQDFDRASGPPNLPDGEHPASTSSWKTADGSTPKSPSFTLHAAALTNDESSDPSDDSSLSPFSSLASSEGVPPVQEFEFSDPAGLPLDGHENLPEASDKPLLGNQADESQPLVMEGGSPGPRDKEELSEGRSLDSNGPHDPAMEAVSGREEATEGEEAVEFRVQNLVLEEALGGQDNRDLTDAVVGIPILDSRVGSVLPVAELHEERRDEASLSQPDESAKESSSPQIFDPRKLLISRALEEAEGGERRLAQGGTTTEMDISQDHGTHDLVAKLEASLQPAREAWSSQNDSTASCLGPELCYMAEPVTSFNRVIETHKDTGNMACLAGNGEVMAVGMASGACLVTDVRSKLDASGKQVRPVIKQLFLKSTNSSVSCLAFSISTQLLVIGHENGDLNFWEQKHNGWECVKTIRDAHTTSIAQATFVEGLQTLAVTAEAPGRLVTHNVSSYLSLTAKLAGKLSKLMQPAVISTDRPWGDIHQLAGLRPARDCRLDVQTPDNSPRSSIIGPACEGLLLILGSLRLCIGRLESDGRLTEMLNLPVESGHDSSAADWQLQQIDARASRAQLVVAGGGNVSIYQLIIPSATSAQTTACQLMTQYAIGPQPCSVLFTLDRHLIVLQQHENHVMLTHHLPDQNEQMKLVAVLKDKLRATRNQSRHWKDLSSCFAVWGRGSLLLTTKGVWAIKVMTWREKMAATAKLGFTELAIQLGLQALQDSKTVKTTSDQIKAQMQSILLTGIGALGSSQNPPLSPSQPKKKGHKELVQLAIEMCLAIDTQTFLWDSLYPQIEQLGLSAEFFEGILPALWQGSLTSLPPDLMQEFVGHFEAAGQLEVVEAAVMRMNSATMDFNQIFRICRQQNLHSALVHIYSKGFQEYIAPAAELLIAIKLKPSDKHVGLKLLVYLRECLRGNCFPPGTGKLQSGSNVPDQILAFILYGTLDSILLTLQDWPFNLTDSQKQTLQSSLTGRFPVFASLLAIDTGGVLSMLVETFGGKFVLVGDLQMALAGTTDTNGEESAEQAFLDATIFLLNDEHFRETLPNADESSESILLYILLSVTEGRVTAGSDLIFQLQEWTCNMADKRTAERQFTDLLAHLKLSQGDQRHRAQEMAKNAGFIKAEAHLLHLSGQPTEALQKLVAFDPKAAFEHLEDGIQSPQTTQEIKSQLIQAAQDLKEKFLKADAKKFSSLVLNSFPGSFQHILSGIATDELRFRFIKNAIRCCLENQESDNESSALSSLAQQTGVPEMNLNETYLQLLCQFRPEEVQTSLENLTAYRVQEILPFCRLHKISGAEACLYERLGDVTAALQIYMEEALLAVQSLLDFVKQASVTEAELQELLDDKTPHSQLMPRNSRDHQDQRLAHWVAEVQRKVRRAGHLCGRHSQDAASQSVKDMWLRLLGSFLRLIDDSHDVQQVTTSQSRIEEGRRERQQVVMRVLEDVTTDMAIHIPLNFIGTWILQEFSSRQLTFFRSSLLSLLAAHNYESNILQTASSLMTSDAWQCMEYSYTAQRQGFSLE